MRLFSNISSEFGDFGSFLVHSLPQYVGWLSHFVIWVFLLVCWCFRLVRSYFHSFRCFLLFSLPIFHLFAHFLRLSTLVHRFVNDAWCIKSGWTWSWFWYGRWYQLSRWHDCRLWHFYWKVCVTAGWYCLNWWNLALKWSMLFFVVFLVRFLVLLRDYLLIIVMG